MDWQEASDSKQVATNEAMPNVIFVLLAMLIYPLRDQRRNLIRSFFRDIMTYAVRHADTLHLTIDPLWPESC